MSGFKPTIQQRGIATPLYEIHNRLYFLGGLVLLRFFAASLRLRLILGFSKNSRRRSSESTPSCCTLLLNRLNKLSKLSFS
jgi:hypothetical protein